MDKSRKSELLEEIEEINVDTGTLQEDQEELETPKAKKTYKQHRPSASALGLTQKLHLATHRTLSVTEKIIKGLSHAYEHIFVGDESFSANFEKEYGLKYYAKNDYKNALKHFEAYDHEGTKNDVDVLYMMAICYMEAEQPKKAAQCLKKAHAVKPDDFDIVTQLAQCLLTLEDYAGALNYFRESIEINPEEGDSYYQSANCLEKLDQIEEAKKMYKKAIDINPREAVYYHALGFLYENQGSHKDAIVCFKKAMDLERARGGGGR